jgi:hypothetical protein
MAGRLVRGGRRREALESVTVEMVHLGAELLKPLEAVGASDEVLYQFSAKLLPCSQGQEFSVVWAR